MRIVRLLMGDKMDAQAKDLGSRQAILLARYKENCEQARHHEALRERTTSMVASTTGVMLGLLGFKEGTWGGNPIGILLAVFIVLLGAWGLYSVALSESRIRRHRERIDGIRKELEPTFFAAEPTKQTRWVWLLFHSAIVCLGFILLIVLGRAA